MIFLAKIDYELIKIFREIYNEFEQKGDIGVRRKIKSFIYSMKDFNETQKSVMWNEIMKGVR